MGKITGYIPAQARSGRARKAGVRENVLERQAAALDLRKRGEGYRQIGQQLGVTHTQAHKDVTAALKEIVGQRNEDATGLLVLELERLDVLSLAMTPLAQKGDTRAALVALKVSQRRAALLGLDAPTRAEFSGPRGGPVVLQPLPLQALSDTELATRLAEAAEHLRLLPPPEPVPVVVPETELETRKKAYSAELARRAGSL